MTAKELVDQYCEFRGKCTTDDVVALNFAYEMLAPRWKSVEDELPPRFPLNPNESMDVITYGLHTMVNWYDYERGEWVRDSEITHWMPLPEAPKEGGEG